MNIGATRWHYEKSCSLEPHYTTTRAPKHNTTTLKQEQENTWAINK